MKAEVMSVETISPRFVITGPSGWIGRAMLAHLSNEYGATLKGRVTAFGTQARQMQTDCGDVLPVRALESIRPADVDGAHVFHFAYLTKDKADILGERVFTDTNLAIDDLVLSAIGQAEPLSVFVASSGAASLAKEGTKVDPYGVCKLRQEARFLEAGERLSIPVMAGRIFNLSGPYINKLPSYAISNMAIQARETGVISITAETPVFRSYLHVNDLCGIVRLAGLNRAKHAEPVDLCGGEVVEMLDLALAISKALDGNGHIERAMVDHENPQVYLGNFIQTKLLAMALGVTITPLDKQIVDTVNWLFAQPTMPRLAE